jgi:beta-xylosidase
MVASSFNQLPGLPLLRSYDLVHWEIVNYIVKRLPSPEYDTPQPGKGIWAPSIRFHNNQFWVFYGLPDEGIFVTHTEDPLGNWSEPHCLKVAPGWIDPVLSGMTMVGHGLSMHSLLADAESKTNCNLVK